MLAITEFLGDYRVDNIDTKIMQMDLSLNSNIFSAMRLVVVFNWAQEMF